MAERGVRARVDAALAAVGFRPKRAAAPPRTDRGTLLTEERRRLAFERSFLAAERTLMAWVRPAMSMISFGFTI